MRRWLHKIEIFVDESIPYLILLLLFIIVAELGFRHYVESYEFYIDLADRIILLFFVADLVFKYIRIRNIPKFIRTCWLDIIAVFPFYLIFRAIEVFRFVQLSEAAADVQLIFHEGLEIEKEGAKLAEEGSKIIKEAEKASKLGRASRFARFIRPIMRAPRLIKALPFFEHPKGEHHLHETRVHKYYRKVKKHIKKKKKSRKSK